MFHNVYMYMHLTRRITNSFSARLKYILLTLFDRAAIKEGYAFVLSALLIIPPSPTPATSSSPSQHTHLAHKPQPPSGAIKKGYWLGSLLVMTKRAMMPTMRNFSTG
jgi:hypothetical protein